MTNEEQRDGTVGDVIDARVAIYGDPTKTFGRIAEVWSGVIGHHINPVEVPLMLIGMKLVRTQVSPDYSDNSDDIEGYLDIFRQLVGEDMVQARLTSEYMEKKYGPVLAKIDDELCKRAGAHLITSRHSVTECSLNLPEEEPNPICTLCHRPHSEHSVSDLECPAGYDGFRFRQ
jgi:hypothetical protein